MRALPPGSTIGILGSGQLGRMFTLAAKQMGYRVHTFSPESDTPTGQVADKEWVFPYENLKAIRSFAKSVDVVTFEFENVPFKATEEAAKHAPVRPSGKILHITQNRLREKTFLKENGFPVTPFCPILLKTDIPGAIRAVGFPAVLKTAGFGYDGKGQKIVRNEKDLRAAHRSFKGAPAILEGFVSFSKELSVVAARDSKGRLIDFGVMENKHKNHILDITISPARISEKTSHQATDLAGRILKKLEVVGVMCVELFLTKSGKILVNELAPRPHNSGHLTIDACNFSQYDAQVRAVCGLPLGTPSYHNASAMANLLGDVWSKGTPKWGEAISIPGVKLHLYGKKEARVGRKMGHLTAVAISSKKAEQLVLRARKSL